MGAVPLPVALAWGEVLVSIRVAPINPADLYTASTGGQYGLDRRETPYAAGHDGVGVIMKVLLRDPELLMPSNARVVAR